MTPEPWQGGEPGEQQEGVFDLSTLADELLEAAVLMAILAGGGLAEHSSPPAATLHVLRGRIRLYAGDAAEWFVSAGQVVAIPPERHSVDALEDSAFLLTVALAN